MQIKQCYNFCMRKHSVRRNILLGMGVFLVAVLLVPYAVPIPERQPLISYQDMLTPASKFVLVEGASIHVEDYMPSGAVKDTIVLIHGFGGSTYSWRNNITAFTEAGYRTVAIDLKGFGLSTKNKASSYSHTSQAGIVSEVVSSLGIQSAIFIGHSMGASVTLQLAENYSTMVKELVLVDGSVSFKQQLPISQLLGFDPFRRILQDVMGRYLTSERLGTILRSAYYQPDKLSGTDLANYYSRAVYGQWLDGLTAMSRDSNENIVDFTFNKNIRTLVVWGDKDTWVGRSVAEEITSFTGGNLKILENAGHLSMEEAPDAFNNMVLEFLAQS